MAKEYRQVWNELFDLLNDGGQELTAVTYILKLEILNVIKQSNKNLNDSEIALLLMIIAHENMHELVDKNGGV